MAPEEKSTDAVNRSLGDYFGASPLERSATWMSDEDMAMSPHNPSRLSALSGSAGRRSETANNNNTTNRDTFGSNYSSGGTGGGWWSSFFG
jgi:hypothetical protein